MYGSCPEISVIAMVICVFKDRKQVVSLGVPQGCTIAPMLSLVQIINFHRLLTTTHLTYIQKINIFGYFMIFIRCVIAVNSLT